MPSVQLNNYACAISHTQCIFPPPSAAADLDQCLRLGAAAGVTSASVLLLMLLRMGKNLLLSGVQRDLLEPLPFNCRCLSRLLQVRCFRGGLHVGEPSAIDLFSW